jgi:hypothetical protein
MVSGALIIDQSRVSAASALLRIKGRLRAPVPSVVNDSGRVLTKLLPGPRNRLYPDRDGVEDVMGAEVADGELGCRVAVRRQVGAGADWIKVT